jgi:hypothetical protein
MHHKFTTNERLGRIEHGVKMLHRKIDMLMTAQSIELIMETENMANFAELAEKVTKISGTVNSTKVFIQGLKARIEELAAGFNDTADQAAIMALAAELGGTEAALAEAIVANPDNGGSMGGVSE